MKALAGLSLFSILLATVVLGIRLLLLARRTRRLPELVFGIAFLSGGLGTVGAELGQRLLWSEPGALTTAANAGCFAFVLLGTIALFVSTWRIFHPDRAWAAGLCALGSGLAIAGYGARWATGDFEAARLESIGMALFQGARCLFFAWNALESFRYYAKLRRRLKLGLADPVAATQILLWGVAGAAMVVVTAILSACIFVYHVHPLEPPPALVLLTLLPLVVSISMWCAFFPPDTLRRWATASASAA